MTADALSQILRRFVIYLEVLPYNLRFFVHTTLFFLATINIALTIYTHIDDDNFKYLKWGRMYILKIGFILLAINKYEWLLNGVKDFFFYAVNKAIRINYTSNDYVTDPSSLFKQGQDVAEYVWKNFVSGWPSDWGYWVFYWLILIGFLILTIQIIICWIEFYFLTGFSIIFLPFGALDMGLEYYKNIFKVIISATLKLAVMQFWVLLSSVILKDLFKVIHEKSFGRPKLILLFGTLYVLVAVMQVLPSLTSGLLTGSPTVNASAAMAGAMAASSGILSGAFHTVRGTVEAGKGAVKGAKTGGKMGAAFGETAGYVGTAGIAGGPIGGTVGKIVGGAVGTIGGAVVGGSYAGAKYAVTKKGAEESDSKDSKDSKDKKNSAEKVNNGGAIVPGTEKKVDTGSKDSKNIKTNETKVDTNTSSKNPQENIEANHSGNFNNNNNLNSADINTNLGNNLNQGDKIETLNNYNSNSENVSTNSNDVKNNNINNSINENIEKGERTRKSLPDWAKEDY